MVEAQGSAARAEGRKKSIRHKVGSNPAPLAKFLTMKVKELKALLEGVDDEMEVLIPVSQEFDGFFYSPCPGGSGVCGVGIGDSEPIPIYEAPNFVAVVKDEPEEQDAFLLVPCGFGEQDDQSHEHTMN